MSLIDEFFREIDAKWRPGAARIGLHVIGSGALMLQAQYQRGTKDSDVLETQALTPRVQERLLELAGKGTRIHTRHRLYIDVVPNGVPFLPQAPQWIPQTEINASLAHFELAALAVVDVVVSKLKRFNPNDKSDIEAMIDRGLVSHADLVSRFRLAIDYFSGDARAEELPKYVRNLHVVERDLLGADETEIDLPAWI